MVNGGFATTTGLVAAAKARGVPVVEVQHGAVSSCAVTAPGMKPHFSVFNSHADAVVSWDLVARSDPAILAAGPLGLYLPNVLEPPHATDDVKHSTLRRIFVEQAKALDRHAKAAGAVAEVIVSLQPGDTGNWVEGVSDDVGPGVLFWIRKHGSQLIAAHQRTQEHAWLESDLASTTALPILLARAKVHLTRFSAVTLEASAVGLPTIATEPYARELYADSIRLDLVEVEPDLARVATSIRRHLASESRRRPVQDLDPEHIASFIQSMMRPELHHEG